MNSSFLGELRAGVEAGQEWPMSYRDSVELKILVPTEWLVDPNSNRGRRRDVVGDFLGHP